MSKEGTISRIAKYKEAGNTEMAEQEEAFLKEHYSAPKATPKPKVEKTKKSE
jgi:hypothetical protein